MNKQTMIILIALVLAGGTAFMLLRGQDTNTINPAAGAEHDEEDGHGHEEESHGHEEGKAEAHGEEDHEGEEHHDEQATTISPEAAKAAGLVVETAGKTKLNEQLPLRGKIILNPETTAEVKARFPGVVRSVRKAIGQPVAKGETLATVESNDSLQTYAVTSPLAGVVLARQANVGDTAAEQAMFTVANLSTVTAEVHVFPQDLSRIQIGQQVQVQSVDGTVEGAGTVKALLPTTDADTQTVQAWVSVDNADGRWRAGMAVQAGAVIGQEEVGLAVRNTALQTMEDQTVVFVKEGDSYSAHPVKLGRSDGTFTEVLEGMEAGSQYVSKNSFIVKADIGKSGAAHEH